MQSEESKKIITVSDSFVSPDGLLCGIIVTSTIDREKEEYKLDTKIKSGEFPTDESSLNLFLDRLSIAFYEAIKQSEKVCRKAPSQLALDFGTEQRLEEHEAEIQASTGLEKSISKIRKMVKDGDVEISVSKG